MTNQGNTEQFTYVQDQKLDCLTVIATLQDFIKRENLDPSIIQVALTFSDPFQFSLFYEEIDLKINQLESVKICRSTATKVQSSVSQQPHFQDQLLQQDQLKSKAMSNIKDISKIESEFLTKSSEEYIQQTQILEEIQKQQKKSALSIQQLEEQRNLEQVERIENIFKSQASRSNSKSLEQNVSQSNLLTQSLKQQAPDHLGIIGLSSIHHKVNSQVDSFNQKENQEWIKNMPPCDNDDTVPIIYNSFNQSQNNKEEEKANEKYNSYYHQKPQNQQENFYLQDQKSHLSIQSSQENSRKCSKQQEENEEQKVEDQEFLSLPNSFQEMKQPKQTLYSDFNQQNDQEIAKYIHLKDFQNAPKFDQNTEFCNANDEQQTAEDCINNILSSSIMQVIKNKELVYEDIVNKVKSPLFSKQLKCKISCQQIDSEKYKFNLEPILVFLFKKDTKFQEFLSQNNIQLINDNQQSANYLLFKIKNTANIEFVANILECLQSFNKYTQWIDVPDAKAIASNSMFQENLAKDHNIYVFFDKSSIKKELVWFSLDKDETYLQRKANEIEKAYSFEKLFLFRNFTNKGLSEDELQKLELDHLNDVMIVRRAFYHNQLMTMRENYPEIAMSFQQRSFKSGKDKNIRLNFALQYEKKDFLSFQKMKKQLEDVCNLYLNFRIVMKPQKCYDNQLIIKNNNIFKFSKNTITVQCQITELSGIIQQINNSEEIEHLEFLKEGELLSYQNKFFAEILLQNGYKASQGIIQVLNIPAFVDLVRIFS